jgi:hypothetical protein
MKRPLWFMFLPVKMFIMVDSSVQNDAPSLNRKTRNCQFTFYRRLSFAGAIV